MRRALEATGVEFELLACDPDFADTAAFCERYGVDPQDSANAIVVAGKGGRPPPGATCAAWCWPPTGWT